MLLYIPSGGFMYLSEIRKRDIIFNSNSSDIENIVYEKEDNNTDLKTDIGFIFGGISMIPHRINQGLKLYTSGLVNKILLSGGIGSSNIDRKTPESIKMKNYLIDNGVPSKDIIMESNSRNTIENIYNSLDILKGMCNLSSTTFTLITSDFHMRRCLGLLSKALESNKNIYKSSVMDGKTDINSWMKTFYGKKLILQEAIILVQFAEKAKINDIEIENLSFTKKKVLK